MPGLVKEFKDFIRSLPKAELDGMGVDPSNLDSLFTSPRDNQPFVVRYQQAKSAGGMMGGQPIVVAYEKTGVDGKRAVVTSLAGVEELDEAQFKQKVPEGP